MDIKTEISRKILAEDCREVKPGYLCEFTVGDRSLCGVFQGITNRGSLRFQNTVHTNVFYHVAPRVIGTLRIAAIDCNFKKDTKVETPSSVEN